MDKFIDSFIMENYKSIIEKHANPSKAKLFSRIDMRVLFLWHLIFAVAPWFIYSPVSLGLLFVGVCAAAILAGTARPLILIMGVGVLSNLFAAGMIALYLGADFRSVMAEIAFMTLKLLIVSLASISVFTSVDAGKISDGLLWLGVPSQVCFAISYGYRMLPFMVQEYREIVINYRIRSGGPAKSPKNRLLYWLHLMKLSAAAFYPLILNTAKGTRTTVEALEMKGFGYHRYNAASKRMKLEYMRIRSLDVIFITGSIFFVMLAVLLGSMISF